LNYLKIVSKGWAGYNGQLNIITFKDGVSTEPVPPLIADRIAACVTVVACNEDGSEGETEALVGIQHRLVTETASRAPIAKPLPRMSDADRELEKKVEAARALEQPTDKLFTRLDLEQVADKSGIKGLREIASGWQIKARSIPDLINEILAAQGKFLAQRQALLDSAGGALRTATLPADAPAAAEPQPEEVITASGFEGMPEKYTGAEGVSFPAARLVDLALRNSGMSLTGWNKLLDADRAKLITQEASVLGVSPVLPEEPVKTPAEDTPAPEGEGESESDGQSQPEGEPQSQEA
jgi:hypothetical protein